MKFHETVANFNFTTFCKNKITVRASFFQLLFSVSLSPTYQRQVTRRQHICRRLTSKVTVLTNLFSAIIYVKYCTSPATSPCYSYLGRFTGLPHRYESLKL